MIIYINILKTVVKQPIEALKFWPLPSLLDKLLITIYYCYRFFESGYFKQLTSKKFFKKLKKSEFFGKNRGF